MHKLPNIAAPESLGRRLFEQRCKLKLHRQELAQISKVDSTTITKLENGSQNSCNANTACRLAKALQVKTDWLVTGDKPLLVMDDKPKLRRGLILK